MENCLKFKCRCELQKVTEAKVREEELDDNFWDTPLENQQINCFSDPFEEMFKPIDTFFETNNYDYNEANNNNSSSKYLLESTLNNNIADDMFSSSLFGTNTQGDMHQKKSSCIMGARETGDLDQDNSVLTNRETKLTKKRDLK